MWKEILTKKKKKYILIIAEERKSKMNDLYASDNIKNYLPEDLYTLHLMESSQNEMLFQALIGKDIKTLKMIPLTVRDLGDSLLFQDDFGTVQCIPPLVLSAMMNDTKSVHYLLEKGAPVNYPDWMERTALMFAAYRGNKAVVKDLLKHGASVYTKDLDYGKTALDYARTPEIRQILLMSADLERTKAVMSVGCHKLTFQVGNSCKIR